VNGFLDRTPVVIAARRTPIGTAGHALAGVDLVGLLAPVLRALVDDLGPDAPGVDDVVIGNCRGPGGNPARVAALAAGLGVGVPGVTVDRQCGSGQELSLIHISEPTRLGMISYAVFCLK